jgi:hypothetical protein
MSAPGEEVSCHAGDIRGAEGTIRERNRGRPISAVRMTAGHNARRGSGPGQNLAFDHAMALVGCPDRRIAGPALRAVREWAAQISVASFADAAEPFLTSTRALARHEPNPG